MKFSTAIFKTFFLSLAIIAQVNFLHAQTASILPNAKTTFVDQNGKPLTKGTVDFYEPGTSTRKTTWQDSSKAVSNANPVVLDGAGRALIWGDGSYRQVVKDVNGNLQWDQVTSSASNGTGGSTIGDGLPVGTILPNSGIIAPTNYQFAYGQALSRASYPELYAAITNSISANCTGGSPTLTNISDTSYISVGAVVESICVTGSPTVISKTANSITLSSNATVTTAATTRIFIYGNGDGLTTFNLPDLRGYTIAGRCNMGGVDCANLNSTYFSSNANNTPSGVNAKGGAQSKTLAVANIPTLTSTNPTQAISVATAGNVVLPYLPAGAAVTSVSTAAGAGGNVYPRDNANDNWNGLTSMTGSNSISVTSTSTTDTPFSLVQPTVTLNYVIKVTPDVNLTSTYGVAAIGGMTGIIACGTNILCTGNTIDVNISSIGTGPLVRSTGAAIAPKSVGTVLYASQYGGADWCANLVLALAALSSNPGTVIIDNNQTINACTAVGTISIGQGQKVQFTNGANYTLNQTIELGTGASLIGAGNGPVLSGINIVGTTLLWTGAASSDPVRIMNAAHARIANIGVDCNSVSDCAGFHYDSTNSPNSSQNTIENVAVTRAHIGFLVGNRGTSHPTVASCNATPSQSGCYEMDFLTLRNFQFTGTCSDLTAEGIHVNSFFALQQSTIEKGNIWCANIAVHNVFSAGSNTILRELGGGSVVGASPTFYQTDSGGATGFNLYNNEDEGFTVSVHDSGCNGSSNVALVYQNNGWSGTVTLDGCEVVTAIGNNAGGTKTVNTNATVNSISELQNWTVGGSGTVYYFPTPAHPIWGQCINVGTSADCVGHSATAEFNAVSPQVRITGSSNNDQVGVTLVHAPSAADQIWQIHLEGTGAATGFASKDFVVHDGSNIAYFGITSAGVVKMGTNGAVASVAATSTAATSSTTGSQTVTGGLGVSGAIWAGTYINATPTVVNSLPSCNSGLDGARAFVTNNATATSFGGAVTTGGANHHPVYCDGSASAWKQG